MLRRTLAWLAGGLGIAGLVRALRRRPQPVPALDPDPLPDPRAEELRRRLDEAGPLAAEPVEQTEAADLPVDETTEPPPPPAATREDVHARARAAIDEMRRSGP